MDASVSARRPLRVVPCALELAFNDPRKNISRIDKAIRERTRGDRDPQSLLFVFPELTLTGFVTKNPKTFALTDARGPLNALREIARRRRVGIVAGFPERGLNASCGPRNALVLIDPAGQIRSAYRKLHLFTAGANSESSRYAAGDAAVVCEYRGWRIAFAVCFDLRFSPLFHRYAQARADLIAVSSCWIGGPHKSEQYRTLNAAHAIAAQAYVVAVNQAGRDPFYEYDGAQLVFSPFGKSLYRGEPCRLDASQIEACRKMSVRAADRADYPLVER